MPTYSVQNFGCRASQADGAAIESLLSHHGLTPAEAQGSADWVVVNTCTVTSAADDEVRQTIRRVHRENPGARIVVTGCYAQRAPNELCELPGVALVVGNSHKTQIGELMTLSEAEETPYHGQIRLGETTLGEMKLSKVHVGEFSKNQSFLSTPIDQAGADRSRPNLKIQDGCGNRCSFCVIPSVRGNSRSAPLGQIVRQVQDLATRYSEIVLTGINLGRWGRESGFRAGEGAPRLAELLRILLAETSIHRLRLSSVEPMDWSNDLLDLMAGSPRIAQHVHAPLQSGSGAVLRRMHRRYRVEHYVDRIRRAHSLMPGAAIGADILTGFPGETEAEFRETYSLIEDLPFSYLHVFSYSERPGTPAAELPGAVPVQVRRDRTRRVRQLANAKNLSFRRTMIGKTLPVVTLLNPSTALTTNYLQVELIQPRVPKSTGSVEIGELTEAGVRETALFPLLQSEAIL